MKITLCKLMFYSLSLLLLLQHPNAVAQVTASMSSQGPAKYRGNQKSLREFLTKLEKTFKVYFTFESSVIRNVHISADATISENLEETLQRVLVPLNLKYEKVADKYYSIFKPIPKQNKQSFNESDKPSLDSTPIIQSAYSVRIRGKVTDELGNPMPGVNVIEKGSLNGSTTEATGEYTIEVTSDQSILIISFVGYVTEEIVVGARTEINVQLFPDLTTLSEIVIVAYSTQNKKDVTAAVTTVSPKDLESRPVTNMFQALQGLAPNLTIQQNKAEPGQPQTLNIRGVGSFTDNSPLVIVDGIVVGALGLQYLNPNDVESISILKDAASSAIYGSQAANGVIYITTKSGKKDEKVSIQYSGMYGWQSPTTSPKAVEGWEFMTLKNEALANSGLPLQFTAKQIADRRAKGSEPWAYDELVNNVVPQVNQSLSITGGGKSTSYLLSAGYMNQENFFNGSYIPDDQKFYYKRYNFRSNISTEINKYIKTNVNLAFTNSVERTHNSSTGIMIRDAMRTPRIYAIQDSLGFVVPPQTSNSVFAQLSQGGFRRLISNNLLSGFNVVIAPVADLTVAVNASANYSFYDQESQTRSFNYAPIYTTATPPQFNEQGKQAWKDLTKTFFATVEYDKILGNHHAKILAGYRSDYEMRNSAVGAARVNGIVLDNDYMIEGDFSRNNAGVIDGGINRYTSFSNPILKTVNSVFGRLNYDYNGKYLFEFTCRYDGATVLAPKNRWFFFPAFSAGWRLTDELFMEGIRNRLGDVKLRYSLGQVGNSNIGGFNYLARVYFPQGKYSFNNTPTQGADFSTINPELEWERSTMANYGVDVALIGNKISASFDYFDKVTDGIYFEPSVPGTLGLGSSLQNFAKVRSVGWEFSLNWAPVTGQFNHRINASVADNLNKVIKVGEPQIKGSDFSTITKEGFPISSYYLFKSNGFYQNLTDVENAPSVPFAANQKVNPGDIRYVDKNSDGVIDGDDRFVLGNPFPRFTFGLTYSTTWKNVDFQMFWQGVGKRVQYLRGDIVEAFHNNEEHAFVQHKDRWTPTNPDATYPRITASTAVNANNVAFSDFWLFDSKYLRLKNLQVGYSLPKDFIRKAGIQNFRIYFSAQNLLTFTPARFAKLGVDPEFTQFNNRLEASEYNPVAGRNYPNSKVLAVGVDVKF
jgi:TonB-linked SusC/RagA family outer membrane protein